MLQNLKEPGELGEEYENIDQYQDFHQEPESVSEEQEMVQISFTKRQTKERKGVRKTYIRKRTIKKFQCMTESGVMKFYKYKCDCCEEFGTNSLDILNKHKFEKHDQTLCVDCGARFVHFTDLRVHMYTHNDPIKCDHCDEVFTNPRMRKTHMQMVHVKSENKFICQECGTVVASKEGLESHKSTHSDPNTKFPCPHCKYTGWTPNQVSEHIKRVHKRKPSSCPFCGKLVKMLRFHIERTQCNLPENERTFKRFKCDLCDKTFSQKAGLVRHKKIFHSNKKRDIKCDLCDYATYTKSNLFIHVRRMHEGKALKSSCPFCFKEVIKMERHINLFHTEFNS